MEKKPEKDEESIFYEALEIPEEKRESFLKEACGDDVQLLRRVKVLLKGHAIDDSFLENLDFDSEMVLDPNIYFKVPDTVIDRYRLLEKIGEGGMAVVYLAQQEKPIKRKVALKIIKLGMDTKRVIARFEAERQALAMMDHPNIARVFDAGTTETGRPYFVMEYIKGMSINDYCDHHKLSIKERLRLFISICEAVQHAHQKGIIHRDIKPSNIVIDLIDGKPVPKIIDFGVAKAVSMPLTEKVVFTRLGQLIGTPEYMSPEQADLKEKDIDTRTDIYSLGIVLYELLAGTLPFETKTLREGGYAEIQRIIREEEPSRPSTKLSCLGEVGTAIAQSRHTELSTLIRSLYQELEWIPLMAIRKNREQRYKTALDLAEDVQNYLEGNPLTAGPESVAYKFKKFIKKRKGFVAAVGSIVTVLIAGLIVSTYLYIQAEDAREQALLEKTRAEKELKISQTVLDFINNGLFSSIIPEKIDLDRVYTRLNDKYEDASLAKASIYYTLGNIYRCSSYYDSAELNYINSLTIRQEELGPEHPDTVAVMNKLAAVYLNQGHYDKSEELYSETLAIQKRILGPEHPDTVSAMHNLAVVYHNQGRYEKAEELFTETLTKEKRILGPEHQLTLYTMHSLATVYRDQGHYNKAEELFAETLAIQKRALGPEHLETLLTTNDLAGVYLSQGRYEKAKELFTESLAIHKRALGPEHTLTLRTMNCLAWLQATCPALEVRNGSEAVKHATRVCELTEWKAINYIDTLAAAYAEARDFETAVKWQKHVIELLPENTSAERRAGFESRLKLYQAGEPYREK